MKRACLQSITNTSENLHASYIRPLKNKLFTYETSMLKDKCFNGTNTKGHVFNQICEFHRPYAINTKAIILRHWKTQQ